MVANEQKQNWTDTLFVRHPELYLPFLERDKKLAEEEVFWLLRIFDRYHVPRGAKILDLSCGIGRHTVNLAKMGYELVGYDLSSYYLEKAKALGNELVGNDGMMRFYQGEAAAAGKVLSRNGDRDFNAIIIMGNSFGFLDENYDSKTLMNILTVAAKSCVLVIQTENRDWRIRNFQPYINFEFEELEVFQNWNLNLETSTALGRSKFYLKDSTNKKLNLVLDLDITIRLYSVHELMKLINTAGWSYLTSYASSPALQRASYDAEHILIIGQKIT